MEGRGKLENKEFEALIKNGPLVSIDLIIKNKKGEILLGYRKNAPAKNKWFVPGGRIRKNETLDEAFKRISVNELNHEMKMDDAVFLNVFEHLYKNENRFEKEGIDTHYIVIAYVIDNFQNITLNGNDQHSRFKWMKIEELRKEEEVHINTKNYFAAI